MEEMHESPMLESEHMPSDMPLHTLGGPMSMDLDNKLHVSDVGKLQIDMNERMSVGIEPHRLILHLENLTSSSLKRKSMDIVLDTEDTLSQEHPSQNQPVVDKKTTTKLFPCHYCQYTATRKGHLTQHERTHTAEKPHGCNECSYRCWKESDLVKHMRTHNGERPYACTICTYRSKQKVHLLRHIKNHEKNSNTTLLKNSNLHDKDDNNSGTKRMDPFM